MLNDRVNTFLWSFSFRFSALLPEILSEYMSAKIDLCIRPPILWGHELYADLEGYKKC